MAKERLGEIVQLSQGPSFVPHRGIAGLTIGLLLIEPSTDSQRMLLSSHASWKGCPRGREDLVVSESLKESLARGV